MTVYIGVGKGEDDQVMDIGEENLLVDDLACMPDEPDETWWAAVLMDEPLIDDLEEPDFFLGEVEPVPDEVNPRMSSVNWEIVLKLYEQDEVITLTVVSYNRGGILVENGEIHGFVPASHLIDLPGNLNEQEREHYLTSYLERKIALKVIECEPEKKRIVFSERAALAGAGQRKELLLSLSEGDIVSGCVTNITSFGAFVDLGGLEGLIHVSELSWGRVQHPSKVLKVGDLVKTMVIEIFEDQGRIALSLKQLEKNPWHELSQKLSPGDVIDAVISSIVKFGAFARLDEGIEGLIHISSMDFPGDCTRIDQFLFEGQSVKVGVINIDPKKRRLGLSLEGY